MTSSGQRIALVCEDQAHRALATFLVDRVLIAEALERGAAHWVNEGSIGWLRSFCGLDASGHEPEHLRFCPVNRAFQAAKNLPDQLRIGTRPIKLRGRIDSKPLKPEAGLWRRVLLLFATASPRADALIVVHDTDGNPERLAGLRQALELLNEISDNPPLRVLIAAPHQDAEAWFIAGFIPQDKAESLRLEDLKAELSFNPLEEPHRLTASPNDAPTDAKRVLRILAFNEEASRPPTLEELPDLCERTLGDLALLEKRGHDCNLVDFLTQLRERLVPLVLGGSSPAT